MAVVMSPARVGSGKVPSIIYGRYDSADAIVQGSVLVLAAGEYNLAGADPALLAGIALQDKDTAPGYAAANNPVPITGREQKISIAEINSVTVFQATLTNGSAVRIAPVQADVGAQYGITAYNGVWTIDKAKTAADARVIVVGIDLERNMVFFRVLADHIAGAA